MQWRLVCRETWRVVTPGCEACGLRQTCVTACTLHEKNNLAPALGYLNLLNYWSLPSLRLLRIHQSTLGSCGRNAQLFVEVAHRPRHSMTHHIYSRRHQTTNAIHPALKSNTLNNLSSTAETFHKENDSK